MGGEEPLEATIDAEINVISKIEEKVNGVYHYRDHYFEDHDISEALHKGARLKERTQVTLLLLDVKKEKKMRKILLICQCPLNLKENNDTSIWRSTENISVFKKSKHDDLMIYYIHFYLAIQI